MLVTFKLTEVWQVEIESAEELAYFRKAEREGKLDLFDKIYDDGEMIEKSISRGNILCEPIK